MKRNIANIEVANSGKIKDGTFTKEGVPTLAFINILVRAFEIQGVETWNENFTLETKEEIMDELQLPKVPMALSTFYKWKTNDPACIARTKAFEIYKLGIKA